MKSTIISHDIGLQHIGSPFTGILLMYYVVGSMDQESSQQLQMWFSEHFFAPKLAGLILTPIVSATVEQKWREKV